MMYSVKYALHNMAVDSLSRNGGGGVFDRLSLLERYVFS